jgi:signal transduction histidine kinase
VNKKRYLPDTNANLIDTLSLNPNQNSILIKSFLKDITNTHKVNVVYRLLPKDSNWTSLAKDGSLLFSSLSAGNYILELALHNKLTNQITIQKQLVVNIATPFYKSWWFLLSVSCLLTTSIFWFIHNRRLLNHKREFLQQKALEQQRKKITADLHDDLGATLSSLQMSSNIANRMMDEHPEQAKGIIRKIELQSQQLSDHIGDFIWSMHVDGNEFMTLSNRIKNFVSDILGNTEMQYRVNIDSNIDTSIRDVGIRKNIVLIVKEAVNNAAKYSQATHIDIELHKDEKQITLMVMDNGIGMQHVGDKVNGDGLYNMRKRTVELNGYFEIITSPNNGTTISCKIPYH